MDESTLLEIINNLRNQIVEIKGKMKEHQKEIDQIEEAHEYEKKLIEEKHQEEIGEIRYIISQQKSELDRLEHGIKGNNDNIKDLKTDLIDKERELQEKIQELKTKTKEYDFLKERFDEKVEEIGKLNDKLIKKEEEHEKYVNEKSIPLYDKGNYSKVDIMSNKMNEDQKNYVIEITRKSLNTYSNHFDCAKYIKDQLEIKYKGGWCVILRPLSYGNSCENYYDDCYIYFVIGEFVVEIAKTDIGDESIRLSYKGNYYKVDNIDNKMSDNEKTFAIETTRKSLNMYKEHFDCAEYIKHQFESKYGGEWCVVLQPKFYGGSCFTYYDSCYIDFFMGEFLVKIFKSSWGNDSIHLKDKGSYYKVESIVNKMSYDQRTFAIETTRKSLNMYKEHFDCAKYIKHQFESKYGGVWCVVLQPKFYGGSCCTYYDSCYIDFYMGEFLVKIFKSSV